MIRPVSYTHLDVYKRQVPHGADGVVRDVKIFTRANGDELQSGVNMLVRVYIAQKRKIRCV